MTWLERAALQLFQRTQKATKHQQHLQRKYGTTDPKVIKILRKLSDVYGSPNCVWASEGAMRKAVCRIFKLTPQHTDVVCDLLRGHVYGSSKARRADAVVNVDAGM